MLGEGAWFHMLGAPTGAFCKCLSGLWLDSCLLG